MRFVALSPPTQLNTPTGGYTAPRINISWPIPPGLIEGYEVAWLGALVGPPPPAIPVHTNFFEHNVSPGTMYTISIKSVNKGNNRTESNWKEYMIQTSMYSYNILKNTMPIFRK